MNQPKAVLISTMLLIMLISFSIGSVIGYNLGITRGKERQSVIDAKNTLVIDSVRHYGYITADSIGYMYHTNNNVRRKINFRKHVKPIDLKAKQYDLTIDTTNLYSDSGKLLKTK